MHGPDVPVELEAGGGRRDREGLVGVGAVEREPIDAGAPVDPNAWNESAARARLAQANGVLAFCKKEGGVTGPGTAMITFGSDGAVSAVMVEAPYAGTKEGDCVAGQFRRQKVNPFQGSPQTIKHSFEIPK